MSMFRSPSIVISSSFDERDFHKSHLHQHSPRSNRPSIQKQQSPAAFKAGGARTTGLLSASSPPGSPSLSSDATEIRLALSYDDHDERAVRRPYSSSYRRPTHSSLARLSQRRTTSLLSFSPDRSLRQSLSLRKSLRHLHADEQAEDDEAVVATTTIPTIPTLEQISKLADRYPFDEEELQQILYCYELHRDGTFRASLSYDEDEDDEDMRAILSPSRREDTSILVQLALSSTTVFTPEDTITRVSICEDIVLGGGSQSTAADLSKRLRDVIVKKAYVPFASVDGVDLDVEVFLEGLAGCTGRRGPKQCLQVIYDCCLPGDDELRRKRDKENKMQTGGCNGGTGASPMNGGDGSVTSTQASATTTNGGGDVTAPQEEAHAEDLIGLCYRLSVACQVLASSATDESTILSTIGVSGGDGGTSNKPKLNPSPHMVSSLLKASRADPHCKDRKTKTVPRRVFLSWVDSTAPELASTLSTFMHNLLFLGRQGSTIMSYGTPAMFQLPDLGYHGSAFFPRCSSSYGGGAVVGRANSDDDEEDDRRVEAASRREKQLLFSLTAMCGEMGGKWHKLYSYDTCGSSFQILYPNLVGYDGPTVTLVSAEVVHDDLGETVGSNCIFGAYSNAKWKESGGFYGNSDGFLFQLEPTLSVYRSTGMSSNFMYCNPKSRSKVDQRNKMHGIGFGGDGNKPRLFLAESPDEDSFASSFDRTYQPGELLADGWKVGERFRIDRLEIWAVGGEDAIEAGLQSRDMKRQVNESTAMQAATVVDKSAFLDDFTSGLLETNLWSHRGQARGRADFRVDEQRGGYRLDRGAQ